MQITHRGHSCLVVETGGQRILIDPGTFSPGFEDETGLDAVLITHQHLDHVDAGRLPQLIAANPGAAVYCEPSVVPLLANAGVPASALAEGQQVQVGPVRVTGIGHLHAEIYREIPRVGNVGMLLAADGEPSLFHPGDSYLTAPDGVDILAVPLSAPWTALKETIDFVRAVRPGRAFPIHDAVVSAAGRPIYYNQLNSFLPPGAALQDLAGAGPVTF